MIDVGFVYFAFSAGLLAWLGICWLATGGVGGAAAYSLSKQLLGLNGRPPLTPMMPNDPAGADVPGHCG